MKNPITTIKDWLPATGAIFSVLLSVGYAISKGSLASERIAEVRRISEGLSNASDRARNEFVQPDETQTIEKQKKELEARIEDATKPGIVQAELMASAQRLGLTVHEVQPTPSVGSGAKGVTSIPSYRVSVQGDYTQIANYLQACKTQRVPARPTIFRVASVDDDKGAPTKTLKAEITVETFAPRQLEKPSGAGA